MKLQKHLSKQSLPEDGLNTRNRAGNDSKQQAYTHATVFNPTTLSIKTENNNMPGSISDLPPVPGEKVIRKRRLSVNDNTRPPKRRCVEGPPVHSRLFPVETILEWKVNNKIKKVRARLLLDSGCTGPILAQSFIKRNDIPVEVKKKRLHVVAANGIEVEEIGRASCRERV